VQALARKGGQFAADCGSEKRLRKGDMTVGPIQKELDEICQQLMSIFIGYYGQSNATM
jgi:hypothetical protein